MNHQQEASALGEIQERLADRFPELGVEVVEAAVRVAYANLRGPIREYVPVLVEHAARERLGSMLGDPPARSQRAMSTL